MNIYSLTVINLIVIIFHFPNVNNDDSFFLGDKLILWPEAESNCRPFVFQTEANHLSCSHFNLFVVIYRSFVRGSITQLAVNN